MGVAFVVEDVTRNYDVSGFQTQNGSFLHPYSPIDTEGPRRFSYKIRSTPTWLLSIREDLVTISRDTLGKDNCFQFIEKWEMGIANTSPPLASLN
jgi:hypothetical protein